MYEPRGHAAMCGAILQPPTRPDADCGVLFIEVSGCLPMCGHGTIGVATVLVETGMVAVTEPVTTVRLDTPAGLVVAEVAVEDGAATAVTLRNVPSFSLAPGRAGSTSRPGHGPLRPRLRRQLLRHRRARASSACRSTGPTKQRLLDAGLAIMDAINEQAEPVHPGTRRSAAATTSTWPRPARTPALPARDGHPPRLVRPLPLRHRHQRPDGPAARARRAAAGHRLRQRVVHRHPVHRPAGRGDDHRGAGGRAAVVPTITGRAWITGTAQYLLDPTTRSPPASCSKRCRSVGGGARVGRTDAPSGPATFSGRLATYGG